MKKFWAVTMALLTCVIMLVGCGASSEKEADPEMEYTSENAEYDTVAQDMSGGSGIGDSTQDMGGEPVINDSAQEYGQKIIYSSYLYIETLDYASSYQEIIKRLQDANGYIASSSMYGGAEQKEDYSARSAFFELRIPVEHYNDFMAVSGDFGNVARRTDSSQDVTAEYIDIEARLASLRAQEERLLALLEKANDLETILLIEDQLTEVRYQIESYTSMLNTYNNLIQYCTVTIDLVETTTYVPVKTKGFGQKFIEAVVNSLRLVWVFLQNVVIVLVYILPYAAIATGVYFLVRPLARRISARNKEKREKRIAEEMARRAAMMPAPPMYYNGSVPPRADTAAQKTPRKK
jgi:hypothetical protein